MQLLQELLEINEELSLYEAFDIALFEDLGNLKKIDKKLFKIFVKKERYFSGKREHGDTQVNGSLGENSKVEEHVDSGYSAAWKHLEDAKVKAIILQYDGDQIFAVLKAGQDYKKKNEYAFIVNPSYFEKIAEKGEYNEIVGGVIKKSSTWRGKRSEFTEKTEFEAGTASEGASTTSTGNLKKIIKLAFDAAKKNKADLKTIVVSIDEERLAKNVSRAKGREGSLPYPTGNKIAIGPGRYTTYEEQAGKYFKSLGADLRDRLDSFKASKAKSFDNPNDLLTALIKEGYFDKLKLMGFTYKMGSDNISFRGLTGQFMGESYIDYNIQTNTPEYDKAQDDWREIRQGLKGALDDEEAQAAYYEAKKKILPPEQFRVVLELDGGIIKPGRIKLGKDEIYGY
jgi:hypothetical protein